MTQPEFSRPITMDAAMLAQLNERVKELNENVQKLAMSVSTRPTREELEEQRRRDLIKRVAVFFLSVLIFGGFYLQQREINRILEIDRKHTFAVCEERNKDNLEFLELLKEITDRTPGESEFDELLTDYALTLEPVDCVQLL